MSEEIPTSEELQKLPLEELVEAYPRIDQGELINLKQEVLDDYEPDISSLENYSQQEFRDEVHATEESLKEIEKVILTTAFKVSNHEIDYEIDVITSECVYGVNLFRDMFSSIRDLVGGRSKASQKVLRDLRKTCLLELKTEAHSIGANAVIGLDLDYSEISGGGKHGMLFLVASGTAVKLKP